MFTVGDVHQGSSALTQTRAPDISSTAWKVTLRATFQEYNPALIVAGVMVLTLEPPMNAEVYHGYGSNHQGSLGNSEQSRSCSLMFTQNLWFRGCPWDVETGTCKRSPTHFQNVTVKINEVHCWWWTSALSAARLHKLVVTLLLLLRRSIVW